MGGFGFAVDVTQFTASIKKFSEKVDKSQRTSGLDVANEILRLSQLEVPHDKGSLQNSGVVQEVGSDIIVGYHEPYAARLHEHPEYQFQKGRKGKYLSDPIVRNAKALGARFTLIFGRDIE